MSGPPKEGKPAGVDRLARIETYWRSTVIAEPDGMARDVLALVEIAKAARVLLDEYEDEETEHGFPFNFALRDAHRSLRSALARLDSGATEGDA